MWQAPEDTSGANEGQNKWKQPWDSDVKVKNGKTIACGPNQLFPKLQKLSAEPPMRVQD